MDSLEYSILIPQLNVIFLLVNSWVYKRIRQHCDWLSESGRFTEFSKHYYDAILYLQTKKRVMQQCNQIENLTKKRIKIGEAPPRPGHLVRPHANSFADGRKKWGRLFKNILWHLKNSLYASLLLVGLVGLGLTSLHLILLRRLSQAAKGRFPFLKA